MTVMISLHVRGGKKKISLTFQIWGMEDFEKQSWGETKTRNIYWQMHLLKEHNNFKNRKTIDTCYAVISLQNLEMSAHHT